LKQKKRREMVLEAQQRGAVIRKVIPIQTAAGFII
jgi:hypothetical protein